jgi:hypothetical protein
MNYSQTKNFTEFPPENYFRNFFRCWEDSGYLFYPQNVSFIGCTKEVLLSKTGGQGNWTKISNDVKSAVWGTKKIFFFLLFLNFRSFITKKMLIFCFSDFF